MKRVLMSALAVLAVSLIAGCRLGSRVPPMSARPKVMLTFDDGLAEHYTCVAPILERYGLRGTFNVIVDRIGTPGYMTWWQLRDLNRRGHAIENHTASHANLVELVRTGSPQAFAHELEFSSDKIACLVGRRPMFLCYPDGQHNWLTDQLVRDYWLRPMDVRRKNFGEDTVPRTETGVGAYIRDRLALHDDPIEIMTHGVSPDGGGWEPFPSVEVFEEHIREIREMQDLGLIAVVLYRDAVH